MRTITYKTAISTRNMCNVICDMPTSFACRQTKQLGQSTCLQPNHIFPSRFVAAKDRWVTDTLTLAAETNVVDVVSNVEWRRARGVECTQPSRSSRSEARESAYRCPLLEAGRLYIRQGPQPQNCANVGCQTAPLNENVHTYYMIHTTLPFTSLRSPRLL